MGKDFCRLARTITLASLCFGSNEAFRLSSARRAWVLQRRREQTRQRGNLRRIIHRHRPLIFLSATTSGNNAESALDDEYEDDPWEGRIPSKCGRVSVTRSSSSSSSEQQQRRQQFDLSYRIVRPMNLSSRRAAPVVTLHGGPSLPSDYMLPLANVLPYRSIVFYDQLGCGDSDQPAEKSLYSIDQAVDDLEALLDKLGLRHRRFHLYGHSFGGTLAYEYAKRLAQRPKEEEEGEGGCLSVVLSSAGTSASCLEEEWDRLLGDLGGDDEKFRVTHQCRTPEVPGPLARAYRKAGSVWVGLDAVKGFASAPPPPPPPTDDSGRRMPSAMILRGEYDFATEKCVEGWKDLFNHPFVRYKTLEGCSHHAQLENGAPYGEILDSFFCEYD